jgi:hypothetical protein
MGIATNKTDDGISVDTILLIVLPTVAVAIIAALAILAVVMVRQSGVVQLSVTADAEETKLDVEMDSVARINGDQDSTDLGHESNGVSNPTEATKDEQQADDSLPASDDHGDRKKSLEDPNRAKGQSTSQLVVAEKASDGAQVSRAISAPAIGGTDKDVQGTDDNESEGDVSHV